MVIRLYSDLTNLIKFETVTVTTNADGYIGVNIGNNRLINAMPYNVNAYISELNVGTNSQGYYFQGIITTSKGVVIANTSVTLMYSCVSV